MRIADLKARLSEYLRSVRGGETIAVLDRAAQPMPTELGILDAIHLATAVLWQQVTGIDLTIATHDATQAVAARDHGLRVLGVPDEP